MSVPADDRVKVTFTYDLAGRRASKAVYTWTGSDWSGTADYSRKFIWRGWLMQAETTGTGTPVRTYSWGMDVSGSVGGAAGIGGLESIRTHDTTTGAIDETYWVVYDEHGNVTGLALTSDGRELVASFKYTPSGRFLGVDETSSSMTMSEVTSICPFLFSTKYHDEETGLSYYGHRYYNPTTGRWLNRDPIAEAGGLNLYRKHDGINTWDLLGLEDTVGGDAIRLLTGMDPDTAEMAAEGIRRGYQPEEDGLGGTVHTLVPRRAPFSDDSGEVLKYSLIYDRILKDVEGQWGATYTATMNTIGVWIVDKTPLRHFSEAITGVSPEVANWQPEIESGTLHLRTLSPGQRVWAGTRGTVETGAAVVMTMGVNSLYNCPELLAGGSLSGGGGGSGLGRNSSLTLRSSCSNAHAVRFGPVAKGFPLKAPHSNAIGLKFPSSGSVSSSLAANGMPVVRMNLLADIKAVQAVNPSSSGGILGMPKVRAAGSSRFGDRSWKNLIVGKAHAAPPHKVRTYREAIQMAKSGYYDRIFLDRSLGTATEGQVVSLWRPDVSGVLRDGRIDMIEVVSPRQTPLSQWMKLRQMETILGELAGPSSRVVTPH